MWLRIVLLGLVFVVLASLGSASRHDLRSLILLGAVWMLLVAALELPRCAVAESAWWKRWVAAVPLAGALVWHAREVFRVPQAIGWVVPLTLLVAALWMLVPAGVMVWRRALLASLVAFGALAIGLVVLWRLDPQARWHLVRHHTLLGTPAWWLLGQPVDELRAQVAERMREIEVATPVPALAGSARVVPPNLVVLMIDTLRADSLAAWGAAPARMPYLDAFLAQGTVFSDVIANSSWTRPSIASLFTGATPEQHGARDLRDTLAPGNLTLAEVVASRGLETVAFVTNYGAAGKDAGFDQGFELFRELRSTPYVRAEPVARQVLEWLDSRGPDASGPGSRGLFLYIHLLDPHEPYLAGVVPTRPTSESYRAAYDAELAELDAVLSDFVPALQARLEGPTAVLLVSDHGEELFEHGRFGHGHTLYEEVLRVPVAMVGDGIPAGKLDARLELRDFFHLALGWIALDGFPVEPWARAANREVRAASVDYSGSGRLWLRPFLQRTFDRMVESRGSKAIWSAYGETRELYDLESDSAEQVNRARREPETFDHLIGQADTLLGPWRDGEQAEPDEETLMQLRALGYAQ